MGKKLVTSFLILALLVLLSGVVGIMVLNKVSGAADMVVKEKVPVQDAVMKAKLKLKTLKNSFATIVQLLQALTPEQKN